jgi:ATP-dependent DNA helicase RecQ
MEMAAYYPQSDARFLDISGVGQVKANQYGETFMAIIRDYCQEHDIPEGLKEVHRVKDGSERRYMRVGEAFNEGETVESLMEQYQVKVGTVLEHLTNYMAAGHALRPAEDLLTLISATTEQQEAAFATFDELGTVFLRPVFDRLEGSVSYDDLKALRLCYMSRATETEMEHEG